MKNRTVAFLVLANVLFTLAWRTPSIAGAVVGGDGECYVSVSGADTNDGKSYATGKASVNACITSLLPDGGQVHVGRGTFTSGVPIIYRSGIEIIGSGPGIQGVAGAINGTRLVYTGTGDAIVGDLANPGWAPSVKIQQLTIDTNAALNKGANAIHVWNAHDFEISDVVINGNYTTGINLDSNSIANDGVTIRNVRIEPSGAGRRVEVALRVPKNGTQIAETNVLLIERLTCNIGAADGGATTKGQACIQVDGVVRQVEVHTSVFMGANYGLNVVNPASATNVWIFAPHVEGQLGKLLNVNPSDNWVNLFGLIGDQVGTFPRNGLIVTADGVFFSGTDTRPGLQVAPSSTNHHTNLVEFENAYRSPVFAWNTQP